MNRVGGLAAEQFTIAAEREYVSRNQFLESLTSMYLSDAAVTKDLQALHVEYLSKRREAVELTEKRVQDLGRSHDRVAGLGRRPLLDSFVVVEPPTAEDPFGSVPIGYRLVPIVPSISAVRVWAGLSGLLLSLWMVTAFLESTAYYSHDGGRAILLYFTMWACFAGSIAILVRGRASDLAAPLILLLSGALCMWNFLAPIHWIGGLAQLIGVALSTTVVVLTIADLRTKKVD